ncbi:XRE family transcriptional regulator [Roseomonas chloroacetimidivorans]|uniref:XRE family transcriptional regulator n=1 Tax=Roseomonas chloroacetimidivorans TaxID=1766656 RepID=UPI003C70A8F3
MSMSFAFFGQTATEASDVALDRLTGLLHITRSELALASGLPIDAVSKPVWAQSPATQSRLRDIVEILKQVCPWAESPQLAFAWYRSQPLPGFGDQTAEILVKDGRAEAVKRYLHEIAVGGYA